MIWNKTILIAQAFINAALIIGCLSLFILSTAILFWITRDLVFPIISALWADILDRTTAIIGKMKQFRKTYSAALPKKS